MIIKKAVQILNGLIVFKIIYFLMALKDLTLPSSI